jgi:CBS domain-containing protein
MPQSIREVMTKDPLTLSDDATLTEAAKSMRDEEIGDVIVLSGGQVTGIVTDRDIVIRAVADGHDPQSTTIGQVASRDLTTLSPDETVEDAIRLIRDNAVRRLPVVEGNRPVGIVSLGDLAEEKDPKSALADISRAPANV